MTHYACGAIVLAVALLNPAVTAAQGPTPAAPPTAPSQVISANPFGLIIDFFNSEYEVRAATAITVGAGASSRRTTTYTYDTTPVPLPNAAATGPVVWTVAPPVERRERYVNGDVFVRYYPSGEAFQGLSFGLKAGGTRIPNQGTYFGYGFDLNTSGMLNDHVYYGTGFGLKRLVGVDPRRVDLKYVPTLRLNVGIGF